MISRFIKSRIENALQQHLHCAENGPVIDFSKPHGEPALTPPDSVSWIVFENPVSLFIGGITAVLLELAEPQVRSGVWDHTTFRTDPLKRMRRTGLAAMVTVYGARSQAERMIAGVRRMHDQVQGQTPDGTPYRANDPELLRWVHATAAYGFLEAYHTYVKPLPPADRDQYYAEGAPVAQLYGAQNAPASEHELTALFQSMHPRLEPSPIIFEFLEIMHRLPLLPGPLHFLNGPLIRAAIHLLPSNIRQTLGLDHLTAPHPLGQRLIRSIAQGFEKLHPASTPAAQARARVKTAG